MKFTVDNYGAAVAEVISATMVKMVLAEIEKHDKSATLEVAEKAIETYFTNKITSRMDSDRIFFLPLPAKIQEKLPDEDDYMMVLDAFNDAYVNGYLCGLTDMQELQREI